MRKTYKMTSATTGKAYEVRKMRTSDSFWLSVYHYRRVGESVWRSTSSDTLAQVRTELHARRRS